MILIDAPDAPRDLTVTGTNKGQITVRWAKPKFDGGSPITAYVIDIRCPPNPEYENVGKVDGETNTFTVDDLKDGGKYYVRVRAENPAGLSESAAELKKAAVAKLPFGEL